MAFISPSGDGMKVILKIPSSKETHELSCSAIEDYYKDEALDNFKDLCRICFESYDPGIYYNPASEVFSILKEEKIVKKSINTDGDIIVDFDEIIDKLVVWLKKKGEDYIDGNKHNYLVKLSSACNRFGIPEKDCLSKLIYKFINKASSVSPEDYKKIIRDVYKNYGNLACTAHFINGEKIVNNIDNKEISDKEILDVSISLKDVIFLDNVRDSMLRTFHTGSARGETTYYEDIDEVYRVRRRELTLFHGIMNHGKSTMLMQLCLIKAFKDGYKFAVFSPESDPPDDFYDDLVHTYIGKPTQPSFKSQMTKEEYIKGMNFIKDHFFYIYPDDEFPTPDYINLRFEELIKKFKIDGCIIDPYNQLDNDLRKSGGREDQYLSSFLTKQKRFAQTHDIFMWIVTHPRGNLSKNKEGNYECPDVYDLSGGAMWSHKVDNVICIYRPYFSTDKTNPVTWFVSQKIKKQKLCGRPGQVIMTFDWLACRYYIMAGSRVHPIDVNIEEKKQEDFDFFDQKEAPF